MKNYKSSRKGTQVKKSNRVVGKRGHRNAPATVAKFLIKEAHIFLSDPLSEKVHAPAQGWKTFNKGIHNFTLSTDMSEEMINLQKSGMVVIRINTNQLARKLPSSTTTIDTVIKRLVEEDLIQLLDRGLYAAGQVLWDRAKPYEEAEAVEVFIPLEITLADLREMRSLEVTRNQQGELRNTNPYRRIFQEWLRVRMAMSRTMRDIAESHIGWEFGKSCQQKCSVSLLSQRKEINSVMKETRVSSSQRMTNGSR